MGQVRKLAICTLLVHTRIFYMQLPARINSHSKFKLFYPFSVIGHTVEIYFFKQLLGRLGPTCRVTGVNRGQTRGCGRYSNSVGVIAEFLPACTCMYILPSTLLAIVGMTRGC